MTSVPLLNHEMLADLETELRRQRVPGLSLGRPGLSLAEMESLVAPLDIMLPAEAQVWWGWRNGSRPEGQRLPPILPYRPLYSLEYAVQLAGSMRQRYSGERLWNDAGPLWPSEWLPISVATGYIVLDCRGTDATPLHVIDYGALGDDVAIPRCPSLGQLVSWWTEALRSGAFEFDHTTNRWAGHGNEPQGLRDSWL